MVAAFSMQPGRAKCKDPAARGEGRREVSPRPSADEMDPEEDLCCKVHLRFVFGTGPAGSSSHSKICGITSWSPAGTT